MKRSDVHSINQAEAEYKKLHRCWNSAIDDSNGNDTTLFLIMMQTIKSLTEKSIWGVVQCIHSMKITDFTGEDVKKLLTYLCSERLSLMVVDQIYLDLTTTFLEIFQTSSVTDFKKVFDTIQLIIRQGIIKYTITTLTEAFL